MAVALNDLQAFGSPELIAAVRNATADADGVHQLTPVVKAVRNQLRDELGLEKVDLPFTIYHP